MKEDEMWHREEWEYVITLFSMDDDEKEVDEVVEGEEKRTGSVFWSMTLSIPFFCFFLL